MNVWTRASGVGRRGGGTCNSLVWCAVRTGGGPSGGIAGVGVATANGGVVVPCVRGGSSGGMRVGDAVTARMAV